MLKKKKVKFCPRCGAELSLEDSYCIKCGYSFVKRKSKTNWKAVLIVIIIFIILWIIIRILNHQPIIPEIITNLFTNKTTG